MTARAIYPRPHLIRGLYARGGVVVEAYDLSQDEATGVWDVTYRNARSGERWHMPFEEFVAKFAPWESRLA